MSEHANQLFGELRSLANGAPGEKAWRELCSELALAYMEYPERTREEWVPYLDQALARWPDHLRVCPEVWVRGVLEKDRVFPGVQLCRVLLWPHALRAEDAALLIDAPELFEDVTRLGVTLEHTDDETGAETAPLAELIAASEARGVWPFGSVDTLELLGGWERADRMLWYNQEATPEAQANATRAARALGAWFEHHPRQLAQLWFTSGFTRSRWDLCALPELLQPYALSTVPRVRFTQCDVMTNLTSVPCKLQLPNRLVNENFTSPVITAHYYTAWQERRVYAEPEDDMPGWTKNIREAADPANYDEGRALHGLARTLHTLFKTTRIEFEGSCLLATDEYYESHEDPDHGLYFNDPQLHYSLNWE